MFTLIRSTSVALALAASTNYALAEDTMLFNGKDLDGWTFQVSEGEDATRPVEEIWVVQEGMLISTGVCTGFLKHESDFEDYVLTFEWRSMKLNSGGVAVSGSGSLFVHASDEKGSFLCPKSVEVSVFRDCGDVYFRDVKPFSDEKWFFAPPDYADGLRKETGQWNHLKLICRGNRLTVFLNGQPVNQVDGLNLTKGAIALQSQRSVFGAPSFYRNIRVEPLSDASALDEQTAAARLAEFKALAAAEEAAKKAAEEAKEREEEERKKMRGKKPAQEWTAIDVSQEIYFSAEALKLPFPADARDPQFDATFGEIELASPSSLPALTTFYRTEMAKRGWTESEKKRGKDSVKLTFQHGQAQVELSLKQKSDGAEIAMDCRGLSFDGTNDPAGLVALGLPQPRAYLFLQKEIELPAAVRDLEFDGGDRCLFKSDLDLQELFDLVGQQLRTKGYRETRRPIVSDNRRYTEFAKDRIELGVNIFSHESGSRAILSYEENGVKSSE